MLLGLYGRPQTWNWLLMFHVFSAFVLVGTAMVVALSLIAAARNGSTEDQTTLLRRVAFRVNVFGVLPGFIATFLLGGALADKEYPGKTPTPDWLDIGWILTFLGGIIGGILLSLLLWWVVRHDGEGQRRGWQQSVTTVVAPLVLATLFVIVFLMAGKPGE